MTVETKRIRFSTHEEMHVVDITKEFTDIISGVAMKDGVATVFVPGSTGALTTIEYEPGLVQDLNEWFEKNMPIDHPYNHEERWHDGNGHSHVRASLVGPSVTVPFNDSRPALGTWQQVVFIDFDTRARERELIVQVIGE